jgi:hypothetical protein
MMNRAALAILFLLIVPYEVEARASGREAAPTPLLVCEIDSGSIDRRDPAFEEPNCSPRIFRRSGIGEAIAHR